jgi:hypothetical protein
MVSSPEYNAVIRSPPTGEVKNNWLAIPDSNKIDLTHFGLGYDLWRATGQDASKDLLVLTKSLDKSLFDGDGDGWNPEDVAAGIDYFPTQGSSTNDVLGAARLGAGGGFEEMTETGKALRVGQMVSILELPKYTIFSFK